jgi:Tfp pilus assembly protein PilO
MQFLSSPKNLFSILIFFIAVVFYYNFVEPFKFEKVDDVVTEYENLQTAYTNAQNQLSLESLKQKKNSLSLQEQNLLENFVPVRLKSGTFVYNLAQYANQNRLIIKSIQYTVANKSPDVKKEYEQLIVEFTVDGRYEDFLKWMGNVENANTLIEIQSVRGIKNNAASDVVTFNVKLSTTAINID